MKRPPSPRHSSSRTNPEGPLPDSGPPNWRSHFTAGWAAWSPLVLAGWLCFSPCAAEQKPISFTRAVVDETGPKDPWVKIVGDLNGDQLVDVIIGGRNGPLVWYAAPEWNKTQISPGGYHTVDGEVGDIDQDGDLDVIVGAEFWYENPRPAGDPSQGPWKAHPILTLRTHDVEVGDLDGDGRPDLVARDQSGFGHKAGNRLHLCRQEKDSQWTYRALDCPHGEGLLLGDVDQDGDLDILIGGSWYENTGDILHASWPAHAITLDWPEDTAVQLGDINRDGRPDVVLGRSEGEHHIAWFEAPANPRSPGWKKHLVDATVDFAHGLALADFDGDGGLDIAAAEMHQSKRDRVLIYLNQDQGKAWTAQVLSTQGSHNLRVADLDADGDYDVIGANWSGPFQPVELWRNQLASLRPVPSGQSDLFLSASAEKRPAAKLRLDRWKRHLVDPNLPHRSIYIRAGDMNGDGLNDVIAGAWWYQNSGKLAENWQRHEIGAPLRNMAWVQDFDGDGDLDVLGTRGQGSEASADFVWARNDGRGRFDIMANLDKGDGDFLQGITAARFHESGPAEIVLSWHAAAKGIQTLSVPGEPSEQVWKWKRLSAFSQDEDLSAGDIDRDGDLDLYLGTQWLENPGTRSEWPLHTIGEVTAGLPDRNRLFDFDGDGRLDAVVGLENGTDVLLFLAPENPKAPWRRQIIAREVGGGFSLDAGDVDGDGDIDVVLGEHRGKPVNRVLLYENRDQARQWTSHVIDTGEGGGIDHHDGTILTDLDGDGDLDLISIGWYNPKVWVYENLALSR